MWAAGAVVLVVSVNLLAWALCRASARGDK